MLELIKKLNQATVQYENGHPIMSDKEWDDLYFKLQKMEKDLGIVWEHSPTQKIHYVELDSLNKIAHTHKMLSLDKTKDFDEVKSFIGNQEVIAMCKMDGLTCSLSYKDGYLVRAETRGNGEVGEDILHNALVIQSIPNRINCRKDLVIDGEIICTYKDFVEFQNDYKNPRNFAAGSIRLLNSQECSKRNLTFVAWDIIEGFENLNRLNEKLEEAQKLGFTIVPYVNNLESSIETLQDVAKTFYYPIDGIVYKFNDIQYGKSLGETSHHFKNAIAYKFYDEVYPSKLKTIEWTMGRTGVLTPVAIFEPIEIDGSLVARASLHNISVMEELSGGFERVGDIVYVYKANQIIPQIQSWEHTNDYNENTHLKLPEICPICGEKTVIINNDGVKVLMCVNTACQGKLINQLDHFCGKKGLDIKGLSKATLEKLINWGWVLSISDIFELEEYATEWKKKPGFGEKSVQRILNAITEARTTTLESFISSLGIPLIGQSVSKEIVKYFSSYEEFRQKIDEQFDFSQFDGFAWNKTEALLRFNYSEADIVYKYLTINSTIMNEEEDNENKLLKGITVVITGSLKLYKNRAELQSIIEKHGGKVVGSISKNTDYLINNDVNSTSTKNTTAKKLGIPIMSEEEFKNSFLTF